MSTAKMPRFVAESALYSSRQQYRGAAYADSTSSRLVPQLAKHDPVFCLAACICCWGYDHPYCCYKCDQCLGIETAVAVATLS
jgi:hypothetical protein